MMAFVYLSVSSVPDPESGTDQRKGAGKLKISRKEALNTGDPCLNLEVKMSKIKFTEPNRPTNFKLGIRIYTNGVR